MKNPILLLMPLLLLSSARAHSETPLYGCTFGGGACESQITTCLDPQDRGCKKRLIVNCGGNVIYDGEFLVQVSEAQSLFQGLTSMRFPAPPAVTIQPGDLALPEPISGGNRLDAHLFSTTGVSSGSCHVGG